MDKEKQQALSALVKSKEIIDQFGKPQKIYKYCNTAGNWIFSTCKFIDQNEKISVRPFKFLDGEWLTGKPDIVLYPIYHSENLEKHEKIIIVNNEEKANIKIPGFLVMTWYGNKETVYKSEWECLLEKDVIIWPDNNKISVQAAEDIQNLVKHAKIIDMSSINKPENWNILDCKDPITFLKNAEMIILNIENELKNRNPVVFNGNGKIDPYLIYKSYINAVYPENSLDQIGGVYWNYDEKKHYWEIQIKKDIEVNLHRWMERSGVFAEIADNKDPVPTIKKVMHYTTHHSVKHISENPFKDSAISPYIHTQNGVIQISKTGIKHFSRKEKTESFFKNLYPISCLPFDYNEKFFKEINPEKDCPVFIHYIKSLIPGNKIDQFVGTVDFFAQILAYCISPIKPNEYFFGLYGKQETGKSFFTKILKSVIGPEFCIERRIAEMESRFATADLWGKKIYIEPDLKTRQILPEDFIKSFSGEQTISVERKHEQSIHGVKTSIAMFFISNYLFQVKGLEGIMRRMIIIPYNNKLKNIDRDLLGKMNGIVPRGKESGEMIGEKYDERPAILALAMQGWVKFCASNYKIQMPDWIKEARQGWIDEATTVKQFLRDIIFDPENTQYSNPMAKNLVYENYKDWCNEEGRRPFGKRNFIEDIMQDNRITEIRTLNQRSFKFDRGENF